MSMMKWVSSNPMYSEHDAAIQGAYIQEIFGGKVEPAPLLDSARPKTSPIHPYFEWDDSVAGEKFRLDQARTIITALHVITDDDERPMRKFFKVHVENRSSYVDCDIVEKSEDLMDEVIRAAKIQLESWQLRYGRYCEYFHFQFTIGGKKNVVKKDQEVRKAARRGGAHSGGKGKDVVDNNRRNVSASRPQVLGKIKKGNGRQANRKSKGKKRV